MDTVNNSNKTTNIALGTDVSAEWKKVPKTTDEIIFKIFEIAKYEYHSLLKKNSSLSFHDAEDIISNSVLKIYMRLKKHEHKNITRITAYTKKTMSHVAIDFIKEKNRRKEINLDKLAEISIDEVKSIKYKKIDKAFYRDKNQTQKEFTTLILFHEKKILLHLNKTEKRVFEALKITHNKKQIATKLGISLRQISNIFKKILLTIKIVIEIEDDKAE